MPAQLSDLGSTVAKQEVAYATLRDAILGGVLGVGLTMPSTRALALRWRLSRGTMETVYDRLCSEGYLCRRRGAGTFVSATIPDSYLMARPMEPQREATVEDARSERTQSNSYKQAERDVRVGTPFVARLPDPDLFPLKDWSRHVAKTIAANSAQIRGKADPAGLPSLRMQIADYLRKFRNIDCGPDDVFMTSGIRHAIDLICRAFVTKGDKVCVEDPCYPFAYEIFALSGAAVAHVPVHLAVHLDGIQTSILRRHGDAKLVYVTPAHQSPLGMTMAVSHRLELLEWAESNDAIIIEDDYDSEFSYSGAPLPALMSVDRSGRTIYCGSFNKTLSLDMRVGFVVAKGDVRRTLSDIWRLVGRSTGLAEQIALESYLRTGAFARHLRVARHAYVQRRDCLLRILESRARGLYLVSGHEAGLHFLLWLRNGQSEAEFCARAASEGIALQPLSAFCCQTVFPPTVVVGYAALAMHQIEEAGAKLAAILAENSQCAALPRDGGRRCDV
ncbi:Transcriptional regulator, GntR family domain / Aspartate aminotransferase [Candidatus Burkholderia verschuerenii]|uniref:Transcriptional regulator, GntR family domain / Aspartate aminotransferase n=1 Tax=Candidatus Burkholderia verschuerenii TaxID=242163 RepID=A0A0L0M4X3_9BURK|nr:PLP-dependent aminotransferase family protein [Candidatus Burkholderia verschuerenii]KND57677.1 Transcriptional regulator, GntR family domain / Aspartate aminotransferase [Candidatus Burkholderia verschuerenii]